MSEERPEERGSFYDAFLSFIDNVTCFILLPHGRSVAWWGDMLERKWTILVIVGTLRIAFSCPPTPPLLLSVQKEE